MAAIARGELRTKCDQAAELQEQNEALLQELLALKEVCGVLHCMAWCTSESAQVECGNKEHSFQSFGVKYGHRVLFMAWECL